MFAKFMNLDGSTKYVLDVSDIEAKEAGTFMVVSLSQEGYDNVPAGLNEVNGRKLIVKNADDEEERKIFCNDVVYLCNDKGQTVDRIVCKTVNHNV